MAHQQTIHFLLTGGTIDSYYSSTKDTVIPLRESAIPAYIQQLHLAPRVEYTTICMKDSRGITAEDRTAMLEAIRQSPCERFIITHGTYTMPETARFLESHLGEHGKTIVLVGSFIPLVGFTPTDAPFNLGFAVARALEGRPEIVVCMNGRAFIPTEVRKLIDEGRFDSVLAPSPPTTTS